MLNVLKTNFVIWILFAAMVAMVSFSALSLISPTQVSAQSSAQQACRGAGGTWTEGRCVSGDGKEVFGDGSFMELIVNTLVFIAGAISVIMIIIGGIRYVISQGDQNAVTSAKNTILYAVIGLIVTIVAYALVRFIINSLA